MWSERQDEWIVNIFSREQGAGKLPRSLLAHCVCSFCLTCFWQIVEIPPPFCPGPSPSPRCKCGRAIRPPRQSTTTETCLALCGISTSLDQSSSSWTSSEIHGLLLLQR